MSSKGRSQTIGNQAVLVFKNHYENDEFTVFDISPDNGTDHLVETLHDDVYTGRTVRIQIKGHEKVKVSGGKRGVPPYATQAVEVKNLKHWSTSQLPVFLVVVDLERRDGYWVFIQRYLKQHPHLLKDLSRGKKVQVEIPTSNRLSDSTAFRSAIDDAVGYIARLNVPRGLAYSTSVYEGLDPRFQVDITATRHGEKIDLVPRSPVEIRVGFSPEFIRSGKLEDLLGRGLPVKLKAGEVKTEGSILIETLVNEVSNRQGMLHFSMQKQGHLVVSRVDAEGKVLSRLPEIRCLFEGGHSQLRYRASMQYGLLEASGVLTVGVDQEQHFKLDYNLDSWAGKPILSLPYYDVIERLFDRTNTVQNLSIDLFIDGNLALSAQTLTLNSDGWAEEIGATLDMIRKARYIAKACGVNPRLPKELTEDDYEQIDELFTIVKGEEVSRKIEFEVVTVRLAPGNRGFLNQLGEFRGEPTRIQLLSEASRTLMTSDIHLGPLEYQMSHMMLDTPQEEVERHLVIGEGVEVRWRTTPQTVTHIRRVDKAVLDEAEDSLLDEAKGSPRNLNGGWLVRIKRD